MKQAEPFGKYLLYGQVAVGGMAEIYKARFADPSQPQVDIALKRILPSYTEDENFVTMFKDEGVIASRLDHPNIIHIFDVGEVNGDWYIAMEFIHGTDVRVLSDACEKYHKCFTFTQVARIICETAKALYYAHTKCDEQGNPLNIVHRDCTPHNIMVSQTGEVKLMDFGIAKAASRATKTRVGTVKGKSSYMSPEQARGKNLDGRSDMFTLATVGWELLTGYRLFKANNDFEILTKVLKSEILHPSDLDSNIPRELGDIMMKGLERDRDMRYEDCNKFAEALENWIMVNGDGSDRNLGNVVLALTNKQGHSPQELPDYHRGMSLYSYEDGNFVPMVDGHPMQPVNAAPAPAPAPAPTPAPAPVAPAPQMMYPDPSQVMPPQESGNKLPTSFLIAFVILFLITVGAGIGGFMLSSGDEASSDEQKLELPEAFINVTTKPEDAIVKINGEKIEVSDNGLGSAATSKLAMGEKFKLTVEKDGYETYESEREIFQPNLNLNVVLRTEEEAQAEKLHALPKLVIKTDPADVPVAITINGKDSGKSPVTLTNLVYGEEVQIVVKPENAEYAEKTEIVYPYKGLSDLKTITLAKAEGKKATPAKDDKPKDPKPRQPKGNGKLSFTAVPWAKVTVDGKPVGNVKSTPTVYQTSAGSHKVEFVYPPKNAKASKSVTVKADSTIKVGYNFNTNKWD